jgi:hypothetical protein
MTAVQFDRLLLLAQVPRRMTVPMIVTQMTILMEYDDN